MLNRQLAFLTSTTFSLLLLLVLLGLPSFTLAEFPDLLWERVRGEEDSEMLYSAEPVLELDNGKLATVVTHRYYDLYDHPIVFLELWVLDENGFDVSVSDIELLDPEFHVTPRTLIELDSGELGWHFSNATSHQMDGDGRRDYLSALSLQGQETWRSDLEGSSWLEARAYCVDLLANGELAAVVEYFDWDLTETSMRLLRLSQSGETLSTVPLDLTDVYAATVRGDGTAILCVYDEGSCNLLALDLQGNQLWEQEIDIGNASSFITKTIACDENGGLIVGGYQHVGDEFRPALTCHEADGTQRWSTVLPFGWMVTDLVVRTDGTITAAIRCHEDEAAVDFEYANLDDSGAVLDRWVPDWDDYWHQSMTLAENGDLLLSGHFKPFEDEPRYDAVVARLGNTANVTDPPTARPGSFILAPVYPNPFNGTATVRMNLTGPSPLTVTVYDLLGRPVRVLHDGPAAPGPHRFVFDARGLATGTYLLRAETEDEKQVRRMLFLK